MLTISIATVPKSQPDRPTCNPLGQPAWTVQRAPPRWFREPEDDPLSDGSVCGGGVVFGCVGLFAFDTCCALSAVQFRAGDVATSSDRERIERQVA